MQIYLAANSPMSSAVSQLVHEGLDSGPSSGITRSNALPFGIMDLMLGTIVLGIVILVIAFLGGSLGGRYILLQHRPLEGI